MKLEDLKKYRNIVIQCHDNPDADALASGFGLYRYFHHEGKSVRLIYSGKLQIQKSNLLLMIAKLGIPIEYVSKLDKPELLIMVDCQYGSGNVTRFEADKVAVFDHHQPEMELGDMVEIHENYGSCSTVIWQKITEAGYEIISDILLATAFFYGLYMDTGQLTDIYHPVDRDMRDTLIIDKAIMALLKNTNMTRQELAVTGEALLNNYLNEELHLSLVQVDTYDSNILGMVSDFVLQTDVVNTCVVYNTLPNGYKLSLRSCDKEIKASDMATVLTKGVGSGGGHRDKAGGFIYKTAYKEQYGDFPLQEYMQKRMQEYINSYEVLYATETTIDTSHMKRYKKLKLPLGYVKLCDIYPIGTLVMVRTLEADLEIVVRDDIYIMIGIQGEVYPIEKEKFERSYVLSDDVYDIETEYIPCVYNCTDGSVQRIAGYAKSCIPVGETRIYARELDSQIKVFTNWDPVNYMFGKMGDYIAVRCDDPHDIYVIEREIFFKTYISLTD